MGVNSKGAEEGCRFVLFCFFLLCCCFLFFLFFNLEPQQLTVFPTKKPDCNEIIAIERILQVLLMQLQAKQNFNMLCSCLLTFETAIEFCFTNCFVLRQQSVSCRAFCSPPKEQDDYHDFVTSFKGEHVSIKLSFFDNLLSYEPMKKSRGRQQLHEYFRERVSWILQGSNIRPSIEYKVSRGTYESDCKSANALT